MDPRIKQSIEDDEICDFSDWESSQRMEDRDEAQDINQKNGWW